MTSFLRGGKGWEGYGYGFVKLFPSSDSSIKHIDVHEAAYSTITRDRQLYEIGCNHLKKELTEQIFISIVAFFDGTHQLVLHKNAECKSPGQVIAWFKKDPSAWFYDKPDVNEATLDNKSFWIWNTKPFTSTMSKLLMYCERL